MKLTGTPRLIVSVVVASSASVVVGSLISANTPAAATMTQKVTTRIGGYGLGLAAGAIAAKYTLEHIDETLETIEMIKTAIKKAQTN
jgi:hypothetical protein